MEGLPEGKHAGCLALRETRREPREGVLEDIAIGCRAVARANLKDTCRFLTEIILRMVENRQFEQLHEQRTWRHGDPRKAWAHIIRQGMLGHQERYSARTEEDYGSDLCWEAQDELKAVGHALLDRIRKQERWTRARWEVYRERTMHDEEQRPNDPDAEPGNPASKARIKERTNPEEQSPIPVDPSQGIRTYGFSSGWKSEPSTKSDILERRGLR